jgi:hypothetical protein
VMAAGLIALIGSFLPFYDERGFDPSAWGSGVFPVGTLIMLFVVAAAALVALAAFTDVDFGNVLTFAVQQIVVALTFFSTILALAFLILSYGGDLVEVDKGVGYFLLLIASIGSLVGAIMLLLERPAAGGTTPPAA